ncbi:hypothetical protein FGF1_18530 [Flavobacteriaceae bacterium GF1]
MLSIREVSDCAIIRFVKSNRDKRRSSICNRLPLKVEVQTGIAVARFHETQNYGDETPKGMYKP